ncbi:MAG: hypothetical protein K2Q25_07535 [Mycobacteriaceae bacterium]|nr:hypothetical protein [Mycobacteriaceae bacterium]
MTVAALGTRLFAASVSLADITRCVYTSREAEKITLDRGIDIGADLAELGFLALGLSTKNTQMTGRFFGIKADTNAVEWCWFTTYLVLDIFTSLELLNGCGEVNRGEEFLKVKSKFDNILGILIGAYPQEEKWSGDAAEAYAKGNEKMQDLAGEVAAADAELARLVQRQSGQVQLAHDQMAEAKLVIYGLLLIISSVQFYSVRCGGMEAVFARHRKFAESYDCEGIVPKPALMRMYGFLDEALPLIVIPVLISTIIAVGVAYGQLIQDGNSNAGDIQGQKSNYKSVCDDARKIVATVSASPASQSMASACTGSGFSAIAPVGSDASDMFVTGTRAAGAGARGRGQRTYVEAVGARESHGHVSLAASMPQSAAPLSAPLAAAGPAGLEQSGDPVTGLAVGGRVPQMNSAGQPTGRTPQLVSQAQRRRAHVASSDPQEPATTENGATASDRYAQSVPVRVATAGASPVQEKTWAERNLG